ncbi:hypothetical protein SRABI126_04774 [Pedobacter sp. Bi126]|nr:hypothetical protein SRABI126_04774 [Pedobacter sp. Bi126]
MLFKKLTKKNPFFFSEKWIYILAVFKLTSKKNTEV